MTCRISCLWSEKSENAVQRDHRCPHIYLSGQFLKVHLQKYTCFEVYSQTNSTNILRNSEAGRRSMSLHYQVWLQHLQKLCEEYEQILQQTCYSSTPTLHHLRNQIVALYRPEQKGKKKSISIMPWILDLKRILILKEKNTARAHWFKTNLKLILNFTTYRFLTMLKLFSITTEDI